MSERISALMDGELEDDEALGALTGREGLREAWSTYHLIGDALRQMPNLAQETGPGFEALLAAEPTVLAPRAIRPARRKLMAWSAAASFAAVAVVLLATLKPSTGDLPGGGMLQRGQVVADAGDSQPDGNINPYLLAHQEFSATGTVQGGAPYVMRAAFDSRRDMAP